ncbi:hypothetical protein M595_6219, partial [Lyngbya aestuarii BL J]
MKRRKFIRLLQTGALASVTTLGISRSRSVIAQTPNSNKIGRA